MKTKLISITKPLIEGPETPEELMVYIARVSNPSNQLNMETADKLLGFMIKHKHWSPFEMTDMTVEIITSRAIAQQILRHRSFSFQEFSQRYAQVVDMEPIELRKTGATNRQSSLEVFDPVLEGLLDMKAMKASEIIKDFIEASQFLYTDLLKAGVAKETARFVLPLTTQTRLYMKGSVRSWIHYLQIRCDEHVQLEHRLIALEIKDIFKQNFPAISTALEF